MDTNKVTKGQILYSGKAKTLYATDDPELLICQFRDDTTAFNGVKQEKLSGKGAVNQAINAFLMQKLAAAGIPTQFRASLTATQTLVRRLQMIPLESVIRNVAAGSLCKRLGIQHGVTLKPPLHELFYKDDALGDPLVAKSHVLCFQWASELQLHKIREYTYAINGLLQPLFLEAGLLFVDAKFEFGIFNNEIYLGDEISPDSCRIWDIKSREIYDKDRFRKDLGGVVDAYKLVAARLGIDYSVE